MSANLAGGGWSVQDHFNRQLWMTHNSAHPLLKVLTLNTHKGFTTFNRKFVLPELRDAVRGIGADLVFIQEVMGSHETHALQVQNWPAQPHYEFLADTIWSAYAYGRNAVYQEGHHGNALLSKYPILRWQNQDVSIHGPEQRGLLHCVVQAPHPIKTEIHAICVHLSLLESHRQQQLTRLCDFIRAHVPSEAPLIVAGDFNDWRVKAHRILERGAALQEVFVTHQGRAARTFPVRCPILRLDRIYVRNLRTLNPHVHALRPWSHLSDHAALSVDIEL